jgi:hypothetical protein
MALEASTEQAQRDLLAEVNRVLGVLLGQRLAFPKRSSGWPPLLQAVTWLSAYAFLWLAIETIFPGKEREPKLVTLIAWAAIYYASSIYLVQSATRRIIETIHCDILPYVSITYMDAVTATLAQRFRPRILIAISTLAAICSLAALWWALIGDTNRSLTDLFAMHPSEFIFCSLSYFVFIFISTSCVVAARFYHAFSEHLSLESERFYIFGANNSPLIKGLAKLGVQVLMFWLLIFLLTLSSMLLASVPPENYELANTSRFLSAFLPIAGFFSLVFSSLLYLKTENCIRVTLQRFVHQQAAVLQQRSNALIVSGMGLSNPMSPDADALDRYTNWQDRIIAGGRYGSLAWASTSIALPFVLPFLTSLIRLLDR